MFANDFSERFATYDSHGEVDVKDLIDRSKIIIVDYLSSAYLQALASNVPTIVLHDPYAYPLNNNHQDFYDGLLKNKILHQDMKEAADFLKEILPDPNLWWNKEEIQAARNEFLKNFNPNPDKSLIKLIQMLDLN